MLIQAVYDERVLTDMFSDGHETKVKENPLNENFARAEFQALWKQINHKYAYSVDFDSEELVRKAIEHINQRLYVSELQYTTTVGRQKQEMNEYEVCRGDSFGGEKTRTQTLRQAHSGRLKYALVGKIAQGAVLTRRTVVSILKGLRQDKLYMFKNNPEEFITKIVRLINEQKANTIVDHISYSQIDGQYDNAIFVAEKVRMILTKHSAPTKLFKTMCSQTALQKTARNENLQSPWKKQRKCVFTPNFPKDSIFPPL